MLQLLNQDQTAGQEFTTYFFFFKATAATEIYTLSLHDALPISSVKSRWGVPPAGRDYSAADNVRRGGSRIDRKSTRLNSSHMSISYAVFCLKKKNIRQMLTQAQTAAQYFPNDQIKEMTRTVRAE